MILIDTSVLIEYFRKQNKEKTYFYQLAGTYPALGISSLTKYEILVGSRQLQDAFWKKLLSTLVLFPFGDKETYEAVAIQKKLLKKNKIIGFADIAIGATAKVHDLELATLNVKHFSRIARIKLLKR